MPDALSAPQPVTVSRHDVNWDIVKVLYLQDIPHNEISAQSGASVHAIRCRAYRERWTALKNNPPPLPQPATLQDLVEEFQLNMALSVCGATKFYSSHVVNPNSGKDARDWEIARQTLIQSGRMLFGLDKDDRRSPWTGTQGNVIDVTATAVTLKSNDTKS